MESKQSILTHRDSLIAFLIFIPIGLLSGLIGLGGAEFRLPVLVGVLKRQAREAVPINLAISLVTIIASLLTRLNIVSEFVSVSSICAKVLKCLVWAFFVPLLKSWPTATLL